MNRIVADRVMPGRMPLSLVVRHGHALHVGHYDDALRAMRAEQPPRHPAAIADQWGLAVSAVNERMAVLGLA